MLRIIFLLLTLSSLDRRRQHLAFRCSLTTFDMLARSQIARSQIARSQIASGIASRLALMSDIISRHPRAALCISGLMGLVTGACTYLLHSELSQCS